MGTKTLDLSPQHPIHLTWRAAALRCWSPTIIPSCILDLRMPEMDGIQTMKSIQERVPNSRLVTFSSYNTQKDVYRAIEAGAQGYVLKEAPVQDIIASVRAVAGWRNLDPERLQKRARIHRLPD